MFTHEGPLVIDATRLTMAEQAQIWDYLEERGLVIDDPTKATPRQGIYYTSVVAWVFLKRTHPDLTLEDCMAGLMPSQVELVQPNPTNGANGAGQSRPWQASVGSGASRRRNTGRSVSKK